MDQCVDGTQEALCALLLFHGNEGNFKQFQVEKEKDDKTNLD